MWSDLKNRYRKFGIGTRPGGMSSISLMLSMLRKLSFHSLVLRYKVYGNLPRQTVRRHKWLEAPHIEAAGLH